MGGFSTIGYCSITKGCCCPHCFLEIFVGGQGCDEGGKVVTEGIPHQETLLFDLMLVRHD